MKAPIGWLKDFTSVPSDAHAFAEAMTLSGSKVEALAVSGEGVSGIATGRVLSVEKHPDADRLSVCRVDAGLHGVLQIVTGATNVSVGSIVPVALDGATLADGKGIRAGKLRGVASEGMMCSFQELGFARQDFPDADEHGIWLLPAETPVGADFKALLGLGETTVDFEITSNRPDCLSIEGLAREAAATLRQPFTARRPVVLEKDPATTASLASVRIEAPELCMRYCARVVRDVRVGPSPEWMRRRLRDAGIHPISNIVDITNYVMLELGQPMHAFDLDRIRDARIIVRRAAEGEPMKTLDGASHVLDSSMLVIADPAGPVALAGVMGGEHSEIEPGTTTILLESAVFHGIRTRLTAKALGFRTESSSRFEKGLDAYNAPRALDRAAELIEALGCGSVCKGMIDEFPTVPAPLRVRFRPARINAFLGTEIPESEMEEILVSLGCTIAPAADAGARVVLPPTWRADLESEADVSEEIARFHGYNLIPASLRSGESATVGGRTYAQQAVEAVKDAMVAAGFYETCTYSFSSPRMFDRLRIPEGHPDRDCVRILNPLGEDYGVMRTTLADSLLTVVALNANRSAPQLRIFEVSRIYRPKAGAVLPDEIPMLSAAAYEAGRDNATATTFLEMKGALEETARHLGIRTLAFEVLTDHPSLHPGRSATVLVDGKAAGWLGTVHPDVAVEYEVPASTVLMSVRMDALVDASTARRTARALPRFPAVSRDIALLVSVDVPVGTLEAVVRDGAGDLLESVELFDVYQGPQVMAGLKSVAFGLVFRAPDRTLKEEEVSAAMASVVGRLAKDTGAELRPA